MVAAEVEAKDQVSLPPVPAEEEFELYTPALSEYREVIDRIVLRQLVRYGDFDFTVIAGLPAIDTLRRVLKMDADTVALCESENIDAQGRWDLGWKAVRALSSTLSGWQPEYGVPVMHTMVSALAEVLKEKNHSLESTLRQLRNIVDTQVHPVHQYPEVRKALRTFIDPTLVSLLENNTASSWDRPDVSLVILYRVFDDLEMGDLSAEQVSEDYRIKAVEQAVGTDYKDEDLHHRWERSLDTIKTFLERLKLGEVGR